MVDKLAETILRRHCPLTCGRPTVFYGKESFDRACEAKRGEFKRYASEGTKWQKVSHEGRCGECRGRSIPPEIEIKQKMEVKGMVSAASKKGDCDLCGEASALRGVHKLRVCGSCQRILADCNNRIEVVVGAIKHLQPERLADLVGESVQVGVESVGLKRIAELVGYVGEDGEELIEAVRTAVQKAGVWIDQPAGLISPQDFSDLCRALECSGPNVALAAMQIAAMLDDALKEFARVVVDYHGCAEVARRHLELSDDCDMEQVVVAIAQVAAYLEEIRRALGFEGVNVDDVDLVAALGSVGTEIARLREILVVDDDVEFGVVVDDVAYRLQGLARLNDIVKESELLLGSETDNSWRVSLVEGIRDLRGQVDELRERNKELEAINAWKDQIFSTAAEELAVPGLPAGELVAHIKSLRDTAGYYRAVPGQVDQCAPSGSTLKMTIGGLTIKIYGLPVDQRGVVDAG